MAATKSPWLISRPEGFYVRARVVGRPSVERGPFQTKAEAIDEYTSWVSLMSQAEVEWLNGDADAALRKLCDPVGVAKDILPLLLRTA